MKKLFAFPLFFVAFYLLQLSVSSAQPIPDWYMNPPQSPDKIIVTGTDVSSSAETATENALQNARTQLAEELEKYLVGTMGVTATQELIFALLDQANEVKRDVFRDRGVFQSFVLMDLDKREILRLVNKKPDHAEPKVESQPVLVPPTLPVADESKKYIFLFENFSDVKEGMVPKGWLGADKMMVKEDNRSKFLTDFESLKKHTITIPDLKIPANFEIKYTFQFARNSNYTHVFLHVGEVTTIIDVLGWVRLNKTTDNRKKDYRNQVIQAVLQKKGPIFKFFINGEERVITRIDDYKIPGALTLEFQNMNNFKFLEIEGIGI